MIHPKPLVGRWIQDSVHYTPRLELPAYVNRGLEPIQEEKARLSAESNRDRKT